MTLIVQPDSGVGPVLTAIRNATKSIDIMIFRLDIQDLRKGLAAAVARGVTVRALIAHTNRGGEKTLRKLEQALLEAGVTVSRTADDFLRYHGKLMLIDDKALHLYGFNFTWLDIERSRSFGLVTKHKRLLQEAKKLFEADCARQPYATSYDRFVVSPVNARDRLMALLKGARRQLLIYDPKISDPALLRILADRAKAGLDVRVIGKIAGRAPGVVAEKYPGKRLHVRLIVQDGQRLFVGSQSLRKLELDHRREVGLIVDDKKAILAATRVFEADWALTATGKAAAVESAAPDKLEEKEVQEVVVSA
jgi:phosphatidylserine/phosphatidylglycerophosphate/cardiolipin synthase-like enzyme